MKRRVILGLLIMALLILGVSGAAQALRFPVPPSSGPVAATQLVNSGFTDLGGSRHNNYAWSMEYFKGDLYVGTGRSVDTFNIMWELLWGAMTPGQRPPELPDVEHPPFLQDFLGRTDTGQYYVTDETAFAAWKSVAQAEIWRLHDGTWSRVYQSPNKGAILLKPDLSGYGYTAPQSSGFRSMTVFTDKKKVQALYAASGGYSFAAVSPLLYRSVDGVNWVPLTLPAEMGRESRAMAVMNGKLYIGIGAGELGGKMPATVWCSDDPSTTESWKKVLDFSDEGMDSTNQGVLSLCAYAGKLYVGTQNRDGFQVYRSKTGTPASSADWKRVVSDGAGDRYNVNAQTMCVFKNMLYVTSVSLPFLSGYSDFKGFEMIRINSSDRWELVVGARNAVDPAPGYETRTPISGQDAGFGNPMAFYGWSMEVFNNTLYVGTLDTSVLLRYIDDYEAGGGTVPGGVPNLSLLSLLLQPGCDLWKTRDGKNWTPVSETGFSNAENYGFRTMQATPKGLYIGTSNPWTGCEIWKISR